MLWSTRAEMCVRNEKTNENINFHSSQAYSIERSSQLFMRKWQFPLTTNLLNNNPSRSLVLWLSTYVHIYVSMLVWLPSVIVWPTSQSIINLLIRLPIHLLSITINSHQRPRTTQINIQLQGGCVWMSLVYYSRELLTNKTRSMLFFTLLSSPASSFLLWYK